MQGEATHKGGVQRYLSMIKFSHTIFAMPFALVGFALGSIDSEQLSWRTLFLVVLCMIFARSAAMAFNRYLDRDIDGLNPRTQTREIPSGQISPKAALRFVIINSLLFMAAAGVINRLCFYLSPVALLVILGYSYTKRYTAWCHIVLGLGLALAPVGAYLATTAQFHVLPVLYGLVVLLWVAGFDVIYALQDDQFDRQNGLSSIPATLGRKKALLLARVLHLCSAIILIVALNWQSVYPQFSGLHYLAGGVFIALLAYQHTLVNANDLSRVNLAFFTTNGVASVLFATLWLLDAFVF